MCADKVYRAIGLMSGTALDGELDVALIETDGRGAVRPLEYMAFPYDISIRDKVRSCFGKLQPDDKTREAEALVTDIHIAAVKAFGQSADVIGFHGQTITHDPDHQFTWQIGDGARLAKETGMTVVADMRQADIKAGGQGAPLLPLYHKALLSGRDKPVAVLNLGGVANITYIGGDDQLVAFDCGPGNALMDDFIRKRLGKEYDEGGVTASKGSAHEHLVQAFMAHPFFARPWPKSLDRNLWSIDCVRYASDEDGMATLLEMTVSSVVHAIQSLPELPQDIFVCGGGRKNTFLLDMLENSIKSSVHSVDTLNWNGDATEAEGFAYLAVRSLLGLPLTVPSTTGVPQELTGGQCFSAGSLL